MADLATLTRRRRIVTAARAALAVSLALALVPALGYLTTAAFNNTLGRRAPFDRESPAAWVEFGARSLVMPALTVVAILVAIWTVAFAVRLLRLVGPIDRLAGLIGQHNHQLLLGQQRRFLRRLQRDRQLIHHLLLRDELARRAAGAAAAAEPE